MRLFLAFFCISVLAMPASASDILVTMSYVELKNDYDSDFSFQWNPVVTAGLSGGVVATVTSFLPKFTSARNHGHARVLKEEQIIVNDRSATPAMISSSLETGQAAPVQNITRVKAATFPGSDVIELGIQISLASPGGSRNGLQTVVTVKNGETAALGGHNVDETVARYNLGSRGNSRVKQSYVIFVTPKIYRSAGDATQAILKKMKMMNMND